MLLLGTASEIHENYKTKKAVSQYIEVLSRTCEITEPALTDIYIALNSYGADYVTMLQKIEAAQGDLKSAERILQIGISEIDDSGNWLETFIHEDSEFYLRNAIESSLSDTMSIAIRQGDSESIASGWARDGVKLVADRLATVKEICEKY